MSWNLSATSGLPPPPFDPSGNPRKWAFQLYVAGMNRSARKALANLEAIGEAHLRRQYTVEVVDLLEQPERALAERVLAVPMLVRTEPKPVRRIIGDLSTTAEVLAGLDLPWEP